MRSRGSNNVCLCLPETTQFGDEVIQNALEKMSDWLIPRSNDWLIMTDEIEECISYLPYFHETLVKKYIESMNKHLLHHKPHTLISDTANRFDKKTSEFIGIASRIPAICEFYLKPFDLLAIPYSSRNWFVSCLRECIRKIFEEDYSISDILYEIFISNPEYRGQKEMTDVIDILAEIGFSDKIEIAVSQALIHEVNAFVSKNLARKWHEDNAWNEYSSWMSDVILPVAEKWLGSDADIEKLLVQLGELSLVNLRIIEIFDMVMAYPESKEGLINLGKRMIRSTQRAAAVASFQKSCSQRLLNGGVDTVDIVAGYIATIRSFSLLDPRGVLLDKVSRPIRRYLRDREDTIPVLILGILGDETSKIGELADMLSTAKTQTNEADVDELLDLNWNPDPIDAPPDFMKKKLSDILGSMLSIYENKEVFVREVMAVFADRLLSGKPSIESIQLNLELLKSRFENRELQSLDVMVRDIQHSNVINDQVNDRSQNRGEQKFRASIISRLFWPSFKKESLVLPRSVLSQLQEYSGHYSNIKQGRVLEWVENLGTVSVVLTLEDRTVELDVTPSQATVIHMFQEKPLTAQQVQSETNLNENTVKSILSFWTSKGILELSEDGSYHVLETADTAKPALGVADAAVSSVQTAEERTAEEMQVYWQYIVGMLTNLGAKPVEQIHSFLKMLVPKETPYTKSQQELEQYLTILVEDQKLEFAQGTYKLPQ